MKAAIEPPDTARCVLVYFVIDPHYQPEWGFDLAFYDGGAWRLWWDGTELDYAPQFWDDVKRPAGEPTYDLMGKQ